jgi:proton glutamate symport protein
MRLRQHLLNHSSIMSKISFHQRVLLSLLLAFALGLFAYYQSKEGNHPSGFHYLLSACNFLGTLFLNALKMVVVPLVFTSVICGVAQISADQDFGRLGLKTVLFYSLTGLLAVATGLICVNLLQPGDVNPELKERIIANHSLEVSSKVDQAMETANHGWENILQIFHRMVPSNLFDAAANGQLLGLISFGLLFGFFLGKLKTELRQTQLKFWNGLQYIILKITQAILAFAPVGIFALVTPTIAQSGLNAFWLMGSFALTVVLALSVHALISLPLLLQYLGKISFIQHYQAMSPALLTAFSTASSSATLPLTMECTTRRVGVSSKISGFTLPLGATLNMDGTALFECVVVIFLAQFFGIEMSWATQFLVVILALLTSVGVAGIPSASLVAILVILQAVGFNDQAIATGVGMIYVVDRILDMSRTMINVLGDSCAAAIIGKSEGEKDYYPTS